MHRKRKFGAAVALAVVTTVTLATGAAQAGTQLDSSSAQRSPALALPAERGITVAKARARFVRQYALGRKGARIEKSLGGHTGGSYLDPNGNLVVTTLDPDSADLVRRSGARAQDVNNSSRRLDSIMNQLDRQASETGAGALQGWYVDVPGNRVVMTVTKGASDASTATMTKLAASFRQSVRIDYRSREESPRPASYLVGGLEFVMPDGIHTCSVGFNTVDSLNRNVVLTAGHCVKLSGVTSRGGYVIGSTRTADFPTDDFGTFWNSYPGFWQPFPSVYLYNGTYATVAGQWDNPPVGATVCKSGRTTGYTCGTIIAVNQTVVYPEGVIYGLVRHTACVEGGDSGGANISAGFYALGVTSGAMTSSEKCLSKFGRTNVSWYQPIGEALSRNGLSLFR
jgi:hypothetical protein